MIVDCAVYRDGARQHGSLDVAEAAAQRHGEGFVWMGLHEPSAHEFEDAAREFELHELAVEDAINAHQRPKLEIYGNSLFMVLKTARYLDETETVEFGEIQIFLGAEFLVVVRHGAATELATLRHELEAGGDVLRQGPGAVLHAIVDRVVDDYAPVLDGLDNDISEVEFQVFGEPGPGDIERIYKLKREVLEMVRATRPLQAAIERIETRPYPHIAEEIRPYFRDVHDHLQRVGDQLETFNDLLTSVLDASLAQLNLRQNEDMRRITAWAAIVATPTLLAGVWGMNFEHMPELEWLLGYPLALGLMAGISGGLWRAFRRAGWL